MIGTDQTSVIEREDLQSLFDVVIARGYVPVGPTVRDGAIVFDEVCRVEDLPGGWTEDQDAGSYRLKRRHDTALFGYNNGPHSWKKYLFPPRAKLWEAVKTENNGLTVREAEDTKRPFAFIGVRSCDLHALQVQDAVFMNPKHPDPLYAGRRGKALVIVVNCGQAAKTCFCTSMNTGPRAEGGYDLALTEILDGDDHYFIAEPGSPDGYSLLAGIPHREADSADVLAAQECTKRAAEQIGRKIEISDVKDLLYRNYDNERWDALERRCLTCANCTMACPTCFCSKVEDVTDLTGGHAERWREWDSCFTMDFSYIHGGSVRPTTRSRYRQWLIHKLATWLDQFGMSGCVGCGRCITWCPVGIDLTEEVRLIRASEKDKEADDG
ncbi:MAG: 4Fe-4S dicluster domain-containing protein [Methyloceanibacter sp.]|nr:4Fe-4S dicluster domain-containing protein [Methyloceanibacter sp.]